MWLREAVDWSIPATKTLWRCPSSPTSRFRPPELQFAITRGSALFFESELSYEDSLEAAQAEIMANIKALSESDHRRKVAHLTGGVDSRLVLASILSCRKESEFAFYCSGGPTEPDKIVAERLAVEFGLTMTNHPGFEVKTAPATLDDQLLWPFQHTSGIISAAAHVGHEQTSTIIASGG